MFSMFSAVMPAFGEGWCVEGGYVYGVILGAVFVESVVESSG